ncbi:hypothetical protein HKL94_01365 [Candidatus Parcubacteria bacterium]|nr:hypothetical protein [Candidatus Parcubacteria bacterium]
MQTVTTKAMAKVAAVATGLAMATSMLSLAPLAHAATTCDIGTATLTVGSSGVAVTCLQESLIAGGYSIPAGATGYFGAETKAAVAAWQAAVGISPARGYFGPISHAHWNLSGGSASSTVAGCTSTTGFSPTTGQSCASATTYPAGCTSSVGFSPTTGQSCASTTTYPAGCTSSVGFSPTTGQACSTTSTSGGALTGAGYLSGESSAGNVTSDIYAGGPTVAVVGDQFTATNGDVQLQRVDATFDLSAITGGTNPSTDLNQYVSDVSLWLGNTELAHMDPALGDKNNDVWTYRFTGLNAVIKSGTTQTIYVEVTPVSAIGSGQSGAVLNAELLANSVRAVGGDGISDTYVANTVSQNFSVSSPITGQLTVTAGSDNPVASQIAVGSSTTTGVKLLSLNLLAKNSSLDVNNLAVSLGTSNSALDNVVQTVYLMNGSTVVKSATVGSGTYGVVTFSNVNQTIPEGSTQNYTITADLKPDVAYADGTTLVASSTTSGWDVSDANGSSITPSSAVVGYTQTLTATGMSAAVGTPTATTATCSISGCYDSATLTIPFTVTAGDNTLYIGGVAANSATSIAGDVTYGTTTTSTSGATSQPTAALSASGSINGDVAGSYYVVNAGTSRTFTLTMLYSAASTTPSSGAFVGAQINSISYGTVAGTEGNFYTSNLSTFETPLATVFKH